MNRQLQTYLNDHLGGSSAALVIIGSLLNHARDPEEKYFLADFQNQVEKDREVLKRLLESLEAEPSYFRRALGAIGARLSCVKFATGGMDPGGLGRLEAWEILSLGVEGKRLLWSVLREISVDDPGGLEFDSAKLEREAEKQKEAIERFHMAESRKVLG